MTMSSQDQEELQRRLAALSRQTGYRVWTRHGQRIFGGPPPGWAGHPEPGRGTEVYCYRLPRNCFEDEVVPVFSSVGRIFELRMMIEFSGNNRGYCYVRYCTTEEAEKAIKSLNNFQIRPGARLAVTRSVDNQKLCFKIVPAISPCTKEEQVLQELKQILDGVVSFRFLNRLWMEVKFESHRQAALARRKVVPGTLTLFKKVNIREVDWADPEVDVFPTERRTIEVRGFSSQFSTERISEVFNRLSEGQVEDIAMSSNSALVTFINPGAAKAVLRTGTSLDIGGERLHLSWGRQREEQRDVQEVQQVQQPVERLQVVSVCPGWGVPQYYVTTPFLPPPHYFPHCYFPLQQGLPRGVLQPVQGQASLFTVSREGDGF